MSLLGTAEVSDTCPGICSSCSRASPSQIPRLGVVSLFFRNGLVWLKAVGLSRGWQPETESQAMLLEANSLWELRWQRQCPLCHAWLPPGETEATATHRRKGWGGGAGSVILPLDWDLGGDASVWDVQCLGCSVFGIHLGCSVFGMYSSGCSV